MLSCQQSSSNIPQSNPTSASTEANATDVTEQQITAFCGGCHAMPKPGSFPKSAWYDEVKRGFDFYHQLKPKDLAPPPVQPVVEYFRSRAPAKLESTPDQSIPGPDRIRFQREDLSLGKGSPLSKPVAVSFVGRWLKSSPRGNDLLISDMANGGIYLSTIHGRSAVTERLGEVQHPAVSHRCDLNGNGEPDLVVAELGSFSPADHALGQVVWFADVTDPKRRSPGVPLVKEIGRVADVQSADIDGDGDLDLVVAEFGWHKTGRVLLLRNEGNAMAPQFTIQVVDPRPGAIHVPVIDLNRDGLPDFVALISQEFEVIEAFLNRGDGSFDKKTIHAAEDPAFGSSGIQVVDMDADGDEDLLFTNGDMFDSFLIKPYHGIQWLENTGVYPFQPHRLTAFPGVHRALAADLDLDGDLDIVAGAFLPAAVRESSDGKHLDSLIWLEQTRPGTFERHALEKGNCVHAALECADFDGDGDLDLAAGAFRDRGKSDQPAVTIWWNDLTRVKE
jgi:hypothetical protein